MEEVEKSAERRRVPVLIVILLGLVALGFAAFLLLTRGSVFNFGHVKKSESIIFGVVEPLSGAGASQGALELQGILFANKLYPTVEIDGKQVKIELVITDNRTKRLYTREAVKRLITEQNAAVILGPFSSPIAILVGPVLDSAHIPGIVMSATNLNVAKDSVYYFRLCFDDAEQSRNMAYFAYKMLGARTACFIGEAVNTADIEDGTVSTFIELTKDDKSILASEVYPSTETDFVPYLERIAKLNPDVIFSVGYVAKTPEIIKVARSMGITAPFIGNSTYDDAVLLTSIGDYSKDVYFTSMFEDTKMYEGLSSEFISQYHETFGKKLLPYAALGADAYLLARRALEIAQTTDGKTLRDTIARMQQFSGVAGPVIITEDGSMQRNVFVKTIQDSQFKIVAENPAPNLLNGS